MAWPPSDDDDVIYIVEVQRCNELGLRFRQNPTGAVLCLKSIPPECISQVVDFEGNILYRNELLNSTAPGDRKAQLDMGTAIQKASLYLQIKKGMESWPKEVLKTEAAIVEEKFYNNYDKNFNDE